MFLATWMNSFLEFEYLEGEGGSDLVLRLWVGQSLAWFYTINLPNYNFPNKNIIKIQRLTKQNTSDLSLVFFCQNVAKKNALTKNIKFNHYQHS